MPADREENTLLAEPFLNSAREKKGMAEIESSLLSCHSPNSWASQSDFLIDKLVFPCMH